MNEYLVITWTDSVPVKDGLAEPARNNGGQPVAVGPVHDAGELDSRPAPAGLIFAGFSTQEAARSWFDAVLGKLDGTTLRAAGAIAPVWWPPEREPERPEWSGRGELPSGRPIREIQTSFGQRRSPVPSSPAHPGATGLAR
jgi:hypothetical protein